MDDRQFWTQVRRGLMTVVSAIEQRYGSRDPFWSRFRGGLLMVVSAIEHRYRFPRSSSSTIGQAAPLLEAPPHSEPPLAAPAPSQPEGVRADGY